MQWTDKHILIIGAARQGLALTRYLIRQGAKVTINDNRSADQLQSSIAALENQLVVWSLGGHPLSLLDTVDLISVSGGVPLDLPLLIEAGKRGIPITNDTQIFMEIVPCSVMGITGSAGKTTTTSLIGEIAQCALPETQTAWVGGNIGKPLIDLVEKIKKEDLVILELSSFQLEQMTISPHIALITNVTPNHLDRHGTLAAYIAAKTRILDFQQPSDIAILNRDDAGAWNLKDKVKGQLHSFSFSPLPLAADGAFVKNEALFIQKNGEQTNICHKSEIKLRGEHNIMNVLAACALAQAAGFSAQAMRSAILDFKGVAHRLEFVRTWNGAKWYNDSIATAPERTIAAIQAFEEPLILLLGGKDKNLPWDKLAQLVHQKVDHVVIFGHAAQKIKQALYLDSTSERPYSITCCKKMLDAMQAAKRIAKPGQVVLLSPGGTSYDEFIDFAERGERYREWVHKLQ